jgi:hypothetical protein
MARNKHTALFEVIKGTPRPDPAARASNSWFGKAVVAPPPEPTPEPVVEPEPSPQPDPSPQPPRRPPVCSSCGITAPPPQP